MHTALIAFELVARLNQIDVDLGAIVREFAFSEQELTVEELLLVAKRCEFRAGLKELSIEQIASKYPLPAIIACANKTYAVLLAVDKAKGTALVFFPGDREPKILPLEEFASLSGNQLVVLRHRKSQSQTRFGFAWFYSEIIKYRAVISEVFLPRFLFSCVDW